MSHDIVSELGELRLSQLTANRWQVEGAADINRYVRATQEPAGTLNSFCASNAYRKNGSTAAPGY